MLKHVQLSPYRARAADTLSLSSNASYSSLSPEPLSSRSSSYSSLSDTHPTTMIKVYAKCLRPDIEYKTLGISFQTTCHEVVQTLLNKCKMRHRDPNLFYLSMEVSVKNTGVRKFINLDKSARPAALQSCHPQGESRFSLQTYRRGIVKIYDNELMSGSMYKSLLISEMLTVDELILILLNCYKSKERVEQFSLYEVCKSQEYERKLHPDDCPLQVQQTWSPSKEFHFLVRRNRNYRPRSSSNKMSSWTPELSTIPCFSRLSLSQPEPSTSFPDYENYFYI